MASKGTLTVDGTLDPAQFWPDGSSDGDTVKIKVDPDNSFSFAFSNGKVTRTSCFKGAWVTYEKNKKTGAKKPKMVISSKNEITVRLQGIDTPELHYPTTVSADTRIKENGDFRQVGGGRAAAALCKYVKSFANTDNGLVHCHLVTHVSKPSDVCDSHGRFVGDIIVGVSAGGESINKWLVEKGWALPLFYNSMSEAEINVFLNAWKQGKTQKNTPGKKLANKLLTFDDSCRIDRDYKIPRYPESDIGDVNYPKVFRRQAAFWVSVDGDLTPGEYWDMLDAGTAKEHDYAHKLADYLKSLKISASKPKKHRFSDFVNKNGTMRFTPIDLVFLEEPSHLFTGSVEQKKEVTSW